MSAELRSPSNAAHAPRSALGTLGGRQITLGPPRSPNFAWVLLDAALIRYRQTLERTHARRGDTLADAPAQSIARELPAARQKPLARWFRDQLRPRRAGEHDPAALDALIETLAEIEGKL